MALNVTRDVLRSRIRQVANMENSTFVTDANLNDLINRHIPRFWDLLLEIGPPDWMTPTDYALTTASGTIRYALPSDFRSVVMVYAAESTDFYRPLRQVNDVDRVCYRAPAGAYSLVVRYIPVAPQLTTDTANATGQIDDISGWSDLIVYASARDCLDKEESDSSTCVQRLQEVEARMRRQQGGRNIGAPVYVTDVDGVDMWPYPYRQAANAYQVFGTNLDVFTLNPVWP